MFCINNSFARPAFLQITRVTDPDLVSMLDRTIAEKLEKRATCLDGGRDAEDDACEADAGDLLTPDPVNIYGGEEE